MKTFARQCSVTGELMNEGWVWGDGVFYTKHLKETLSECRNDRDSIIYGMLELSAESVNDCSEWKETEEAIERVNANVDTDEDLLLIAFQSDYLYYTEWERDDHQYAIKDGITIMLDTLICKTIETMEKETKEICVPIMYYTNETGEIIYDEEGMTEYLKNEIKTIINQQKQ